MTAGTTSSPPGSRRFRLLEVDARRPLLRADVEYLDDVSDPADALLAEQVTRRFTLYRAALSGQVPEAVDPDDPDDDADLPDDPTVLSYLVTAAMLLPTDERQGLLAAATTGDRLALARSLLGRETALITTLSAVPSLDVPGVTPSVN